MVDIQEENTNPVITHSHDDIILDVKEDAPLLNPSLYKSNIPEQLNSDFPSLGNLAPEYSSTEENYISHENTFRPQGKLSSFSPGAKPSSHAAKKPIIIQLPAHYFDVQNDKDDNIDEGLALKDNIPDQTQDSFSQNDNSLLENIKQRDQENKDLDTILDSFLDSLIPRKVATVEDPKPSMSPLEKTLMMSVKSELMLKKNVKPAKVNVVALVMDENHTEDARETHEIVEENILGIVDDKVNINSNIIFFY